MPYRASDGRSYSHKETRAEYRARREGRSKWVGYNDGGISGWGGAQWAFVALLIFLLFCGLVCAK